MTPDERRQAWHDAAGGTAVQQVTVEEACEWFAECWLSDNTTAALGWARVANLRVEQAYATQHMPRPIKPGVPEADEAEGWTAWFQA